MEVITMETKSTRNNNKPWTSSDISKLNKLIKENTPTRVIGLELGRTPDSIYSKAQELGKSLKPTNQSPYNRREKN
jgi:hypothetical protein